MKACAGECVRADLDLMYDVSVCVCSSTGKAQLQCNRVPSAMLALNKHPNQSIGLIRCVCFFDCRNERKQKEVLKRGRWVLKKSRSE